MTIFRTTSCNYTMYMLLKSCDHCGPLVKKIPLGTVIYCIKSTHESAQMYFHCIEHTHTSHTLTEPDKEACSVLVQTFLSSIDEASLSRFISLFLLQSNSTSLRWQAHKLLHTLYQYSQTPQQVRSM